MVSLEFGPLKLQRGEESLIPSGIKLIVQCLEVVETCTILDIAISDSIAGSSLLIFLCDR